MSAKDTHSEQNLLNFGFSIKKARGHLSFLIKHIIFLVVDRAKSQTLHEKKVIKQKQNIATRIFACKCVHTNLPSMSIKENITSISTLREEAKIKI